MPRQMLSLLLGLMLTAACGDVAPTPTPVQAPSTAPQGGAMVVMVMIREDAARTLQRQTSSTSESQALLDAAQDLGIILKPLHPGSQDSALVGAFQAEVPDLATAERVVTRLRQIPSVESVYVKPMDELP